MHNKSETLMYIAALPAGTIFHSILVWTAQLITSTSKAGEVTQCAPLYKLSGHCGSVLRLQWACNRRLLLSAADDRTARVWRLPESWWLHGSAKITEDATCATEQSMLVHTLWGHTARVWDATLIGSCASSLRCTALHCTAVHHRSKLATASTITLLVQSHCW